MTRYRDKHPRKKVADNKMNGAALTHMRDVAYGKGMEKLIRDTRKHSESMRDDEALLNEAEQKRARKAAQRAAQAAKS